jgi:hypothetical protein
MISDDWSTLSMKYLDKISMPSAGLRPRSRVILSTFHSMKRMSLPLILHARPLMIRFLAVNLRRYE